VACQGVFFALRPEQEQQLLAFLETYTVQIEAFTGLADDMGLTIAR
jgi:hypothetical protein